MKFRLIHAVSAIWVAIASPTYAQSSPVVVELFTSQGCSSCPPADALLHTYANRNDIIALAMHVDYWDYIGWKDTFASPEFTRRQRLYARSAGRRMVYTPQMIVAGHRIINGHRPSEFQKQVGEAARAAPTVSLDIRREGESLQINATRLEPNLGRLDVQLIRYTPISSVDIRRGENAGRTIEYSNIVKSVIRVRDWSQESDLSMNAAALGDDPIVVMIQRRGHGPILAAARLF